MAGAQRPTYAADMVPKGYQYCCKVYPQCTEGNPVFRGHRSRQRRFGPLAGVLPSVH